jgi:hypothetical protein
MADIILEREEFGAYEHPLKAGESLTVEVRPAPYVTTAPRILLFVHTADAPVYVMDGDESTPADPQALIALPMMATEVPAEFRSSGRFSVSSRADSIITVSRA